MALKLKKKGPVQKPVKKNKPKVKASVRGKSDKQNLPVMKGKYIEGVGRRKVAVARVRLYPEVKESVIVVNEKLASDYFYHEAYANMCLNRPFEVVGLKVKPAVSVKVSGSGVNAQLDAVVHGLARALVEFNPEYKPLLRQAGMLTRDDRMKETRKVGRGGKARRKRQSPKR